MFELVQGEGGVLPLEKGFVKGLADLAEEYNVLLIADEVQTGNGRTGKLYGYMNFDITPDIVSTAKGLAGGLPLGATMMTEEVASVFAYGLHGSTFGGNPVACAGALHILNCLTDEFLAGVDERAALIQQMLVGAPGIRSVSGLGLMVGIEPVGNAKEIILACMERGVICLSAKQKIRLLPPLNIPLDALKKALSVILEECAKRA